ncbi:hypothetical protein I0C86_18610 [Plantactinospora sp. S1510]|uniref:Uncharacterized protein n=1 Tax=Plantactinospora alkalitolerans TaxID=2789879 RepID=A0ABS0GXM7_9ACTN|nr:hypothetical protein [Plantactinospora alkalitolerans]MBF9130956.1 hypothetical protein [Plantactinospora alkalitolerans]
MAGSYRDPGKRFPKCGWNSVFDNSGAPETPGPVIEPHPYHSYQFDSTIRLPGPVRTRAGSGQIAG